MSTINNEVVQDSRFFEGHIWVSDEPECKTGLCFKGEDREAVARKWVGEAYWKKGRTYVCYTMKNAGETPYKHEVTI